MFVCTFCRNVVPPKTTCKKVVTSWRVCHYPERKADPRKGIVIHRPIAYIDEKGKRRYRYPSDPGGNGYEIAREVPACPKCFAYHEKQQQEKLQYQLKAHRYSSVESE